MYPSMYNLYFDTPNLESKVILNLLAGSMDLLDGETYGLITRVQQDGHAGSATTDVERAALRQCVARGYVLNNKQEEEAMLAALTKSWRESLSRRVESITVYPTFTCNLACVYCFEPQSLTATRGVMSPAMLKAMMRAIDIIHEAHGTSEPPMVTLFGGEPLLSRKGQVDLIEELLRSLRSRDYHIGVITNGVELPLYSNVLEQYGVETVEVTLDGPKEIHDRRRIFRDGRGSFDIIVKGIDTILTKNIQTVVRVNVDRQNIDHLPSLADFVIRKGWPEAGAAFELYAVESAGCETATRCDLAGPEMLARVFEVFESYPQTRIFTLVHRMVKFFDYVLRHGALPFPSFNYCAATTGTKYSFDLMGNVFPCCCMNCCSLAQLSHGRFYPELTLDHDTINLWRKRTVLDIPKCKECPDALLCGSGCTRVALLCGESIEEGVVCPPVHDEFQTALNYYYQNLKQRLSVGDELLRAADIRAGTPGCD